MNKEKKVQENTEPKATDVNNISLQRIAIVRVRGGIDVKGTIKKALALIRLYRQNFCVIIPNTTTNRGVLNKVRDYVTWGEIDDETFNLLVQKRGKEYKGRTSDAKGIISYKKFIVINNKKFKPYFRLNPPRGGFERKGIKKPYGLGGALGYRKEKINDLLKRMM